MSNKKKEEQKEELVSIYDPTIDAFREVPESVARQFIKSAKDLEQKLEDDE
jgi:RNase P subunit RPR2